MLEGIRINLRTALPGDVPLIAHWYGEEEISSFLTGSPLLPSWEQQFNLKRMAPKHEFDTTRIMVIEDKSHAPCGFILLHSIDWKNSNLVNDIAIPNISNRGKKLGVEALYLLSLFAFDELNMHKISGHVYDFNTRSIDLNTKMKSIGVRLEGTAREHAYKGGK